jgi:bla regulator protein blaR1
LLKLAATIQARPVTAKVHGLGVFNADVLDGRVITLMKKKALFSRNKKFTYLNPGIVLLSFTSVAVFALAINVDKQPSNNKPAEKIYLIGNGVTEPQLINVVDPGFPPEFPKSKEKFSDYCIFSMVVDVDGKPQDIHVVRSLGPGFDEMVMTAAKEYRFIPSMYKGKPVPVRIRIEVNFRKY